jgi:hypothetical protein
MSEEPRRVVELLKTVAWPAALLMRRQRMRNPITFNDKVTYKMLRDRRPLIVAFADKVAARDYVRSTVGPEILTELYAVAENPESIPWHDLPAEFVCKASHASGGAVITWADADVTAELPENPTTAGWRRFVIRPEAFDAQRMNALAHYWITRCYSGRSEWVYRKIPPAVLVEERLSGPDGASPTDYKLHVIHGRVRWIQLDHQRFTDHKRDIMTPNWERVPVAYAHPPGDSLPPRPSRLRDLISLAESLGRDTDYVRVDLYLLPNDRIVFGELTNYPEGGKGRFEPSHFDAVLGAEWSVPRRYMS